MLVAQDFRDRARAALSGNWAVAVGTGFVASLLGAYTAFSSSGGSSSSSSDISEEDLAMLNNEETAAVFTVMLGILAVVAVIALIFALVQFIIGGPITLGYVKFNLDMLNGQRPQFNDLFSQFHRFGDAFLMQLMRGIFTGLWTLLFIIPGIIASYSYAMAPYILYENPNMSGMDAIKESKELMKGNKWRLFCLGFSFIGWSILAAFTCGIGMLWLHPYQEAAYAAFYQEIKREKYGTSSDYYNAGNYNSYASNDYNPYAQNSYQDSMVSNVYEDTTSNPYEQTSNPYEDTTKNSDNQQDSIF